MTAIILTYYIQRRKHLPMIIAALKNNMVSCTIIVFNQGKIPLDPIEGVTVINSEMNFGCSVRHSLALCIEDDCFFFQDDDLMVLPNTIEKMQAYLTPDNVVGVDGCILTDGSYTTAIPVRDETRGVSIVTGRVHLCKKKALVNAFELRERLGLKIFREDDIVLSLANRDNMVVKAGIVNFDEAGIGLSHEPAHYTERDKICRAIYETITQ